MRGLERFPTDFQRRSDRPFESITSPYCCTPAGARTLDTLIKSQVLYQLSYGCITFYCFIQLFC